VSTHATGADDGTECNDCHAYTDVAYSQTWVTGDHGDGQITINDDGGGTYTGWQRGTGGDSEKSACTKCHGFSDATRHDFDKTWNTAFEVAGHDVSVSCTGCHDGSQETSPAELVTDTSPHAKSATGYECQDCHGSHGGGTIEIPNNTTVGINYTGNGESGVALGTAIATGATEAEICWNCHDGHAVSEWGTNTGGTYHYGNLWTNSGMTTQAWNWTTGYWESANFSYKNGPLANRPTDSSADPGTTGGGSVHATGGSPGTQNENLGDIRCSYCHDVHELALATGDTASGKPYLRGTWNPSPYPEDGAPLTGDTYSAGGNPYGDVPRGNTGTSGPGGYQIDQNNGDPNSGYSSYANDDGLCNLCHDQGSLESAFEGHKNAVLGFSNDTSVLRNKFNNDDRSTAHTRFDPSMAYYDNTGYGDAKGWMGGLRNKDFDTGIAVPPTVGGRYGYDPANFEWGVTVDNSTVDVDFHSFTCSKCHNPHASRLPRLMITNCLDVQRNTWDDQYIGDANWSNWPNITPSGEGNEELAYSNSAQNCHRYFPAQSGSGSGSYQGNGWNNVTPW
jgi:hypothetical protein